MSCGCGSDYASGYGNPYGSLCNTDTPYPSVSSESVPSLINNLVTALYGTINKDVSSGQIVWNIPCDPNQSATIFNVARNPEEGLMCYFIRAFQTLPSFLNIPTPVQAGLANKIWIANRTDNNAGDGSLLNPYDGSTQAKFDAILSNLFTNNVTNIEINIGPGTFITNGGGRGVGGQSLGINGWLMLAGWKIKGSGRDITTLKLNQVLYKQSGDYGYNPYTTSTCVVGQQSWDQSNQSVSDITIDCNLPNLGTTTSQSFTGPASQGSVSFVVSNASVLSQYIGKYLAITPNQTTGFVSPIICNFLLTGVNTQTNTITLQNNDYTIVTTYRCTTAFTGANVNDVILSTQVPYGTGVYQTIWTNSTQGTTFSTPPSLSNLTLTNPATITTGAYNIPNQLIPSGRLIVPQVNIAGVGIGASNCSVENVHVKNGCAFNYEGGGGIGIGHVGQDGLAVATNNLINNCVVDNLWGQFTWPIIINGNIGSSANSSDQFYITANVTNNTIIGNGNYQGYCGWSFKNSKWSNNYVQNCPTGFFNDTAYCFDNIIADNIFDNSGIYIASPSAARFRIADNNFTNINTISSSTGVVAINLGTSSNFEITDNTFSGTGAAIQIGSGLGTGHLVTNNIIPTTFTNNSVYGSAGQGYGNGDPASGVSPIGTWQLSNPFAPFIPVDTSGNPTGTINPVIAGTGNTPIALPQVGVTTLSSSGTTATALCATAHNFTTGMTILIQGANQTEYNGEYAITYVNPTTFTYTFVGSTTPTATGTILAYNRWYSIYEIDNVSNYEGMVSIVCGALGSRHDLTALITIHGFGNGAAIRTLTSQGYGWPEHLRISRSGNLNFKLEIALRTGYSYVIGATMTTINGGGTITPSVSVNSAPYATIDAIGYALTANTFNKAGTINIPSISGNQVSTIFLTNQMQFPIIYNYNLGTTPMYPTLVTSLGKNVSPIIITHTYYDTANNWVYAVLYNTSASASTAMNNVPFSVSAIWPDRKP